MAHVSTVQRLMGTYCSEYTLHVMINAFSSYVPYACYASSLVGILSGQASVIEFTDHELHTIVGESTQVLVATCMLSSMFLAAVASCQVPAGYCQGCLVQVECR